ncbi:ribokinase [Luteococcus peritonei]|uniref:Ribokinase n=1 Tax=Luteococcus peritonei TaxID=88874 RepID=A0ABW4RUN1_9ACTN
MGTVVVVGSINADLGIQVDRFPGPGETLNARGGTFSPGGKGANQALAAALHGAQVTMLGAVGDDAAAQEALGLLREAGVDLDQLAVQQGPTGIAVVCVDASGENQILVVPGANAAMGATAVEERADLVRSADVVVLQGEIPRDGIEAAARLAEGRVVLNLAPVVEVDPEVLRLADPLVVNEHEARLVHAQLQNSKDQGPEDEQELVRALSDQGCRSVVMTLGARGALVCRGQEVSSVESRRVEVVDTTGAGDAFVGVLAARLAEGNDLVEASRQAALVAADVVQRPGAQASYRPAWPSA